MGRTGKTRRCRIREARSAPQDYHRLHWPDTRRKSPGRNRRASPTPLPWHRGRQRLRDNLEGAVILTRDSRTERLKVSHAYVPTGIRMDDQTYYKTQRAEIERSRLSIEEKKSELFLLLNEQRARRGL